MMFNKGYSFTKLYIGVAILLFTITFGWKIMVDQSALMPELQTNLYNGSTSITNLSSFQKITDDLQDNVNLMESESNSYTLGGITYIDLPIKYIGTIANLFANIPGILIDIIRLIGGILPGDSTLLVSLLVLLSGLFGVLLVVRFWKNMAEP